MQNQGGNYITVEMKDNSKIEGIIVSIDKINSKILLSNAKKTADNKEEYYPTFEINKADIKEVSSIEKIQNKQEEIHNINAIPENKKIDNLDGNQLAGVEKAYDKNKDFFDSLKSMTNSEVKEESKNCNQKNRDTFNLTENDKDDENKNNFYNKRGRGRGRGRGYGRGGRGYNRGRGGGYNNRGGYNYYHNDYQQNGTGYDSKKGGNSYHGQNYRGRGKGRGGRGGRGGYKNNYYNNGSYQNNQKQNFNQQTSSTEQK